MSRSFGCCFTSPEGRGLASGNQRLGAEFQIRYALAVERLGMGGLATKMAQEVALTGLDEAYAPYEAAVYRAIVAHAFQHRDAAAYAPRPTRFAVGDAYTFDMRDVGRRCACATRSRSRCNADRVPAVLESVGALPSPLARTLLEMTLYARAGDTERANAIRQSLAQRAMQGVLTLGGVLLVRWVYGAGGGGRLALVSD
jgi:hypothetical protein